MESNVEEISSVQRRIKVDLTMETVAEAFNKAWKDLQTNAQLKGFRKGKVPLNYLKKIYNKSVAAEVADSLIKENLFNAIEKNSLRPISSPVLEEITLPEQGEKYSFSAVVEIMPTLDLKDYKGLSVSSPKMNVDSSMVDRELEIMCKSHSKKKSVEPGTKLAKGFLANITYKSLSDDETIKSYGMENYELTLGESYVPFKELEDALYEMTTGETKKVTVQIPKDFNNSALLDKQFEFELSLNDIHEVVLPELNDAFAKDVGFETMEELRTNLKSRLEDHAANVKKQHLEAALLTQIIEKNPFDIPPTMVESVIDDMISRIPWGKDADLKVKKADKEFRKHFSSEAQVKAKNTLVLWEISQKENIQVTDEDVDSHIDKMLSASKDLQQKNELKASFKKSLGPKIKENLIFEKSVEFLIRNAQVTETEEVQK